MHLSALKWVCWAEYPKQLHACPQKLGAGTQRSVADMMRLMLFKVWSYIGISYPSWPYLKTIQIHICPNWPFGLPKIHVSSVSTDSQIARFMRSSKDTLLMLHDRIAACLDIVDADVLLQFLVSKEVDNCCLALTIWRHRELNCYITGWIVGFPPPLSASALFGLSSFQAASAANSWGHLVEDSTAAAELSGCRVMVVVNREPEW